MIDHLGDDLHLYIYYRSRAGNAAAVIACVHQLQQALHMQHCVCGELLQRTQGADDDITWMECYRDVAPGFMAQLEDILDTTGLQALIEGTRHCEVFQECLPTD